MKNLDVCKAGLNGGIQLFRHYLRLNAEHGSKHRITYRARKTRRKTFAAIIVNFLFYLGRMNVALLLLPPDEEYSYASSVSQITSVLDA